MLGRYHENKMGTFIKEKKERKKKEKEEIPEHKLSLSALTEGNACEDTEKDSNLVGFMTVVEWTEDSFSNAPENLFRGAC